MIKIPVDKISESKRILTQNDCGDWINGKKKWSDFPEINDFTLEEFERLKTENENQKSLIITLQKKNDELRKEAK
jgi:hypothetical protein